MSLRLWFFPLLLFALVLPHGLNLDLCACAADGHALLCGELAPEPVASSCCSAPPADDAPCPGCPVVELPDFQLDLPAAPAGFDLELSLCRPAASREDSLSRGFQPTLAPRRSRAPPGRLRLYLLLRRVRC